jgi:hypothetical protein
VDTVGRRKSGVAVGDVGGDRDRAVSELGSQLLEPVDPAGQQSQPAALGGEGAGGRGANPGRRAGDHGDRAGGVVVNHECSFPSMRGWWGQASVKTFLATWMADMALGQPA